MAGIPLNTFRTYVKNVQPPWLTGPTNQVGYMPDPVPVPTQSYFPMGTPPDPTELNNACFLVYTAPLGITSVILYAQVANTGLEDYLVTCWHYRPNLQPVAFTELVTDIIAPTNDALLLIGGKLVLETGDALYVCGNAPILTNNADTKLNTSALKLTLSILESANQ